MSARFRSTLCLPILLSTLNIQISLVVRASQSNSQPISNSLDTAPIAQHDKSPRPHLSDYPTGSVNVNKPFDDSVFKTYNLPVNPSHHIEETGSSADRILQTSPIRSQSVQDNLEDKRAFKFGKRSLQPAVDDELTGLRNKMAFKFGKKWDASEPRYDFDEADKRAFKFGKKSNLEPFGSEMDMKRGGFKFGKRYIPSYIPETIEFIEPKRAFKFGKRSDYGKQESNTRADQDTFAFSRLPSIPEASDLVKYDRFSPLREDQNPGYKFGKRSPPEDWEQQVKHQQQLYQQRVRDTQRGSDMRRLFKLGKKSVNEEYDDLMSQTNEQLDNEEMKRQFKFGK